MPLRANTKPMSDGQKEQTMGRNRIGLAGLIPVHHEEPDVSSAVSLSSTARSGGAQVLHISVETQSIRYRADGTAPTANTGVLLTAANSPYWFHGYNGTSDLKFIEVTGGSVVEISSYRHD